MSGYRSYSQLTASEEEGIDYTVRLRRGSSGIAVVAIHGGRIEPGTTEISEAMAGSRHSMYTFSGIKISGNAALHMTSRLFDEPRGILLAAEATTIISIHGCGHAEPVVFIGGRHHRLADRLGQALEDGGFRTGKSVRYPGLNRQNFCNRGRLGMGVQLEISVGLRRMLFGDLHSEPLKMASPLLNRFMRSVASVIDNPVWGEDRGHA